jgi:hypothetical protein
MARVAKLTQGQDVCWIDHNNFLHGEHCYQVEEVRNRGRVKGFFYWRCGNEILKATVFTEAGVADSRPPAPVSLMYDRLER